MRKRLRLSRRVCPSGLSGKGYRRVLISALNANITLPEDYRELHSMYSAGPKDLEQYYFTENGRKDKNRPYTRQDDSTTLSWLNNLRSVRDRAQNVPAEFREIVEGCVYMP